MKQDFMKWLEEHKDEYGVKIIENPSKEQKEQFEKDYYDFMEWLNELKSIASK